jgi:hypothetical protein
MSQGQKILTNNEADAERLALWSYPRKSLTHAKKFSSQKSYNYCKSTIQKKTPQKSVTQSDNLAPRTRPFLKWFEVLRGLKTGNWNGAQKDKDTAICIVHWCWHYKKHWPVLKLCKFLTYLLTTIMYGLIKNKIKIMGCQGIAVLDCNFKHQNCRKNCAFCTKYC